jgi:hypothetical protein
MLLRSRLTLLASVAALGAALPACGSDDAANNDADDARQQIERSVESLDDDASDAARDAADEVRKGLEDVDGD